MLGTRGCRLGLQFPEIYEMQVRAIVRAAAAVESRTGAAPLVEIMHPLVGFREELARLRELTERVAAEERAAPALAQQHVEGQRGPDEKRRAEQGHLEVGGQGRAAYPAGDRQIY